MLSRMDLAILNGVCESALMLRVEEWEPVDIFDDGTLAVTLAEDFGCVKVTLRGERRNEFGDWLDACQARSGGRDRPRSNREVPHLGDRIIFKPVRVSP